MATVKVKLLRPLNGQDIGTTVEYEQADADRLAGLGAVEIVAAKKERAPKNKAEPRLANKAARSSRQRG